MKLLKGQIYDKVKEPKRMKMQSTPPVLSSGHTLAYVLCHCLQDLKVLTHPGESHRAPMLDAPLKPVK